MTIGVRNTMKFLVAFSSPKRSAKTLEVASDYAKSMSADLVLLRVIPDPKRVGVVAELIATDRPAQTAKAQIDEAVAALLAKGLQASGEVREGPVVDTIIAFAKEIDAKMIFLGTRGEPPPAFSLVPQDPLVHYLVDNCPISICLVRP
jgi:nucleotide-binding universal stress UspA family protein